MTTTVADIRAVVLDGVETVVVAIPLTAPTATARLVADALEGLVHQCVLGDFPAPERPREQSIEKDGRTWRVGDASEVFWIQNFVTPGPSITSAIPPAFESYATVVIPDEYGVRANSESALLRVLVAHTTDQPWWLGYLDTGAHDVVFDDAWKTVLYSGWSYVLIEAGPTQAGSWRADDPWRGRLPDLVFPADRSWLVSMMWDDDWRCLGGRSELVQTLLDTPSLDVRTVSTDVDATPPEFLAR